MTEPKFPIKDTLKGNSHNKKGDFVHLHNHTDFSILDGMCRITDLIKRAKELGMAAVAMTDHGNMAGAMKFYKTAKKEGIKPIIGCEIYCVPDMKEKTDRVIYHLVLLAKDDVGYKNLLRISSAGYLEGLYYKPRVDLEHISSYAEGLIALTGCIAGYIPSMIIQRNIIEAENKLGQLKDIFGNDLYIELMDHGLTDQGLANPTLIEFSGKFGIPIVSTNDCHYIGADDYFAHDVLLCIQTKKKLTDTNRFRFPSDQLYFKTAEEMAKLFPKEYLARTIEVAEKCNLELDLSQTHLPQFLTPDGSDPNDYLWKRMQEEVQSKFSGNIDQTYMDRLDKEYEVIKDTGFASYFLIIDDLIHFAKKSGINVGAGRGSVVGSLVSFILDITDADPLEHNLLFERFLMADRINLPDIDLDFSSDRREEIFAYMRRKYVHTAQITTFNRMAPRSLIRSVGKALDMSPEKIDYLAKAIPEDAKASLRELQPEVYELWNADPLLIDICTRLHKLISHTGKHAGGIVISDVPISEIAPLQISNGEVLTQYDKDDVEEVGLVKIDILGTRYAEAVKIASDFIEQRHGIKLGKPDMDDIKTFDLICSRDSVGIFQFGRCVEGLIDSMNPRNFNDLVHLISIGRPGVLDSGLAEVYFFARSSGDIQYLHPYLKPILEETQGAIIFQEQVMRIAVSLAGFSWCDSDKLCRAVAKQKMDLMDSMETQFISGCLSRDVAKDVADKLWSQIRRFGSYCFNKSHAVGYAMLTYQTAYLKTHFPLEYFAGLLSAKGDDEDKGIEYIAGAKKRGIRILNPDINISTGQCVIANDSIYLPLTFIKDVGKSACEEILGERSNGEFKSYADFCDRVVKSKVNKRVREKLIISDAFSSFDDRQKLLSEDQDISDTEIMMKEKEALGTCISEHLLDDSWYDGGILHINEVENLAMNDRFVTIGIVGSVHEHYDKRGRLMAFIRIEDNTGILEAVIFAGDYVCSLMDGDLILLTAKLDSSEPLKAIATKFDLLSTPNIHQEDNPSSKVNFSVE